MTIALPEHAHNRHSCWTRAYSLRHCEGYSVCDPEAVGYVDEIRLSSDGEAVEMILVRALDGGETFSIPADLIDDIDPDAECIRLASALRSATTPWARPRRPALPHTA